jgi:hypothetical protein
MTQLSRLPVPLPACLVVEAAFESPIRRFADGEGHRQLASDRLNPRTLACDVYDLPDVTLVRGEDHGVASSKSSFHDGDVHDIVEAGLSSELADPACLIGAHRFDLTAGQYARQACLPGSAHPGFSDDRGSDDRHHILGEKGDVEGPHASIVPLAGDQGTGVVSDASHQADFVDRRGRPRRSRARAKPSAISTSVKGPCSRSQAATPRRPTSSRRRSEAVSAIHALNVFPDSAAASSTALASSGGKDTDRLSR